MGQMGWVVVYLVVATVGTVIALTVAIKTGRKDDSRPMFDYPRWQDEQKRRRASLDGKPNYDDGNKKGRTRG